MLRSISVVLAGLLASSVAAAPIGFASEGDIMVTLYDEECSLPEVANLPTRLQWKEEGEVVEGCYAVVPPAGAVIAYFADKTVVILPMAIFKPLTSM